MTKKLTKLVQNAAARLLTESRRRGHITPVLYNTILNPAPYKQSSKQAGSNLFLRYNCVT